jgi:hypothetical protein
MRRLTGRHHASSQRRARLLRAPDPLGCFGALSLLPGLAFWRGKPDSRVLVLLAERAGCSQLARLSVERQPSLEPTNEPRLLGFDPPAPPAASDTVAERLALGRAYVDSDLVFCRDDGEALRPRSFSRAFDRHVATAELLRIRLHDLRHTWATLALSAGVHPKIVSERLGHATIAITLDTYSHVSPGMQQDAADTATALLHR